MDITPPDPAGESRRALTPAGLELHAGASCPGPLWRKAIGLGCAAACTTPLPAVQPGLVTQDDFTTGRAGGDWDGGTGPGPWTQHRNRCRGAGLLKLGAHDSDDLGQLTAQDSEQYGPKE